MNAKRRKKTAGRRPRQGPWHRPQNRWAVGGPPGDSAAAGHRVQRHHGCARRRPRRSRAAFGVTGSVRRRLRSRRSGSERCRDGPQGMCWPPPPVHDTSPRPPTPACGTMQCPCRPARYPLATDRSRCGPLMDLPSTWQMVAATAGVRSNYGVTCAFPPGRTHASPAVRYLFSAIRILWCAGTRQRCRTPCTTAGRGRDRP